MKPTGQQQQALDRALQLHGSGQLGDAERIYRGLLHKNPDHADALHYLGVIGLEGGHFEQAIELIQRAVDLRPDYVDAMVYLGNALNSLGCYEAAIEQFERALTIGPATAALLGNLGTPAFRFTSTYSAHTVISMPMTSKSSRATTMATHF